MHITFLQNFFSLELPTPGKKYPTRTNIKSDLKLLLEIGTNSKLKQGQDKKNQNKQIFYCKNLGKECFKIQVEFFYYDELYQRGEYTVVNDYTGIKHKNCCQNTHENSMVIKIYNLMMLKRNLIEQFMNQQHLNDCSPQTILQKISNNQKEYFYHRYISGLENRRKIKKRFDNIINITIKKKKQGKGQEMGEIMSKENFNDGKVGKKKINKLKETKALRKKSIQLKPHETQKKKKKAHKKIQKQLSSEYSPKFDEQYNRPKKSIKHQSNCSIYSYKGSNPQQIKANNISESYLQKGDSIFEEEQEDYFKRNSQVNIAFKMLNEVGSHNYWPESNNSIEQGNTCDIMRMDDLFASIRNSLMKSLDRKSLHEIDCNIGENVQLGNDVQFEK